MRNHGAFPLGTGDILVATLRLPGSAISLASANATIGFDVGSEWIEELAGKDDEEIRRRSMEALRAKFRPEFLNRVDETIIFRGLDREDIKRIVELQLDRVREQLRSRRIAIEVEDSALEALAAEGYDPVYGARPLRRVIQRRLQNPLALALLKGDLQEGGTVRVSAGEGGELNLAPGRPELTKPKDQ